MDSSIQRPPVKKYYLKFDNGAPSLGVPYEDIELTSLLRPMSQTANHKGFEKIKKYALKELSENYPNHSLLKNNRLKQEQKTDKEQQQLDVLQKNIQLHEQLAELKQKKEELKNRLAQQMKLEKKKAAPTKVQPKQQPCRVNNNMSPIRAHWLMTKKLADQFGVRQQKNLVIACLLQITEDIWNGRYKEDCRDGMPIFCSKKHLLCGSVGNQIYRFSPCTHELTFHDHPYNPQQNSCSIPNCKQYQCYDDESSISDSYDGSSGEDIQLLIEQLPPLPPLLR
ncbi:MAG TPA: hypothetical protein VK431_04785 [Nitrosopumilaceae archaeon]|nr:hypothetical protein [Nitrosopumilaceae archaeon]